MGSFFRCVASRTASLLLRFGGVWVDVKIVFFESGASLLLRFGGVWVDVKICLCFVRDVVACKVWVCVGGC